MERWHGLGFDWSVGSKSSFEGCQVNSGPLRAACPSQGSSVEDRSANSHLASGWSRPRMSCFEVRSAKSQPPGSDKSQSSSFAGHWERWYLPGHGWSDDQKSSFAGCMAARLPPNSDWSLAQMSSFEGHSGTSHHSGFGWSTGQTSKFEDFLANSHAAAFGQRDYRRKVKCWSLLGNVTPSKLLLKRQPKVKLWRLSGKGAPFNLWSKSQKCYPSQARGEAVQILSVQTSLIFVTASSANSWDFSRPVRKHHAAALPTIPCSFKLWWCRNLKLPWYRANLASCQSGLGPRRYCGLNPRY